MPNWCEFDLRVSGKATEVHNFETRLVMNRAGESDMVSMLAAFLPIPEALRDTVSPYRDPHSEDQVLAAEGGEQDRMRAENVAHRNQYEALKATYGAGDWYAWTCQTWGVKWADRSRIVHKGSRSLMLTGECPWGPPLEGLTRISAEWPTLRFTIEWFECGMGFAGKASLHGGEIVSTSSRDYRGGRGG